MLLSHKKEIVADDEVLADLLAWLEQTAEHPLCKLSDSGEELS